MKNGIKILTETCLKIIITKKKRNLKETSLSASLFRFSVYLLDVPAVFAY